jgi:IS5 family transposase
MHQSKKGNDWHFGMKAHIGVDATSGLVHTLIGMAGNVPDVTQAHALLHGDEIAALGDAGYRGVEKRKENLGKSVTWHVAMKRAKRKALPKNKLGRKLEKLEQLKASVRAKVEHTFHVIKNLFRHRKRAIAAWPRTRHNCLPCSASPIWYWPANDLRYPTPELRPERRKAQINLRIY